MSTIDGLAAGELRTVEAEVSPAATAGSWTVTFRSQAVAGTLAVFAGTLALSQLDIVSAMIRLNADGTVFDTFDVIPLDGRQLDGADATRLAAVATAALKGERDLAADLRDLRRALPPRPSVAASVELHADSALATGVNVTALDRPGLLYDIASTLTAHGMRTRSVVAFTFNGQARDTFRVVDADGQPPSNPGVLEALRADLTRVCST